MCHFQWRHCRYLIQFWLFKTKLQISLTVILTSRNIINTNQNNVVDIYRFILNSQLLPLYVKTACRTWGGVLRLKYGIKSGEQAGIFLFGGVQAHWSIYGKWRHTSRQPANVYYIHWKSPSGSQRRWDLRESPALHPPPLDQHRSPGPLQHVTTPPSNPLAVLWVTAHKLVSVHVCIRGAQLHHYLYSHIQQEVGVAFTESSPHCCTTIRPIVQNKT